MNAANAKNVMMASSFYYGMTRLSGTSGYTLGRKVRRTRVQAGACCVDDLELHGGEVYRL